MQNLIRSHSHLITKTVLAAPVHQWTQIISETQCSVPSFSQSLATPLARARMCRLDRKEGGIAQCSRLAAAIHPHHHWQTRFQASSCDHRQLCFHNGMLGVTPGNQFSLIQFSEKPEESAIPGSWFANLWNTLPASDERKVAFLSTLQTLAEPKPPSLVYYRTLFHTFKDLGNQLEVMVITWLQAIVLNMASKKTYRILNP